TASLDTTSEHLVLDALHAMPKDCTIITITHRLSQLRAMDNILMLDKGQLIADGSPHELLQHNAHFRQFVMAHSGSHDDE
ncbi:MAG: cysteine/glutathione ABC transporter permease/ATP-binding protein CydD, partial [Endozoicomonas sp.]